MKKRINIGILFFGISFLLTSCQKDDLNISTETFQEKRFKKISITELNSRLDGSKDYDKLNILFDINKINRHSEFQRLESGDEAWLLTDEIVMIERDSMTFYTFRVGTNNTGIQFYNFVTAIDNNDNILSMRMLEYTPNEEWLQDNSQPFSGTIQLIENTFFTSNDITNSFYTRSEISDCIIGLNYEWDCNDGYNHPPNSCPAGGSDIIITPIYGPCPAEIDAGDSADGGGWPVDTGNTGGGSNDNDSSNTDNTNDNDNNTDDDCITDLNGDCIENDDTTVLTPRATVEPNPCDELNKLSNDFGTKNALTDLGQNTNQEDEKGYALKKNSSDGSYRTPEPTQNSQVTPNQSNAQIPMQNYLGGEYIGIFHTHPRASDGFFPMFGSGDIDSLFFLAKKHNTNGGAKTYSEYVVTLTVPQGTYAIKIKDQQKFAVARNLKWTGDDGFIRKLTEKYDSRNSEADINDLIKDLLDVFKDLDMGVGLYKASDDLNSWSELVHDLNPLSPTFGYPIEFPCQQL
ncbi:hypothetical protein [Psychroserpens sp. MEBiC05023]